MIDERHEELAALHALDLLEGAERAAFERELATNAELRALVAQLRESSAALAHTAPNVELPAGLKARILASADHSSTANQDSNIVRPPFAVFRSVLPWAAAAGLAFATAALTRLYFAARTEAQLLAAQQTLTDLELKSVHNQLEAERILARQQLAGLNQQFTDTARQLTDATQRNATTAEQLATTAANLAAAERRIADAQTALTQRAAALEAQTAKVAALETDRARTREQLTVLGAQVADLTQRLRTEADLANLKITALASMLKNSPQALAVAVWNPEKQEGVLKVDKLPALAADKDYQLWVVDPQYPNPVDGGVFSVDPQTGAQKVSFKAKQPVSTISAFAVTLERKGGVPKAEGPFVLLGK